jgi:NitT/TauT family transport system ATP-binding protein
MRAGPAVELRGVHKSFGELVVLDDFDLSLGAGAVTALTGPNGSGKTTVGRLVLGVERADAGTVAAAGGQQRAAVFQENRLCAHLSAVANVELVLGREHRAEAQRQLRQLGLDGAALTTPVGQLSGGQRRRVAIARALAGDAPLVVLDEPCAGIDVEGKSAVVAYVRERIRGRTVLLITHDASEAAALGARLVRMPVLPQTEASRT